MIDLNIIYYNTFYALDYISDVFNLDVKSLSKHEHSLVSRTRPSVEKPLLIVLSHLRGFNLHPTGLSTPMLWITHSECHLRQLTLLHTDEAANDVCEQHSQ